MVTGTRAADTAEFAQALSGLKRNGSNLLLVGAGCEEAHLAASRRLLGSDDTDSGRDRLLVMAGADTDEQTRLSTVEPETVVTLHHGGFTRGAVASGVPNDAFGSGVSDGLETLEREVDDAVSGIEATHGSFEPSQLRVCVDSLVPLVDEYGLQATYAFLRRLTDVVRERRAMAHYHLQVPLDDSHVKALTPLFEAVIELRDGPDGPEQRWQLTEYGVSTDWIGI